MSSSHQRSRRHEAIADCPVSVSDIARAIEAGEFDVADSYIRRLAAADPRDQRSLQAAIPGLLSTTRSARRQLAAKLRRQGQTRQAKLAYKA